MSVESHYPRPRPIIGDDSAASERAADPQGWSFPPAAITQLGEVIDARRDIRRYRPDPVPDELIKRVLTAGHHGPSVGYSQPWRFILIRDQEKRDKAALMADAQRMKHAQMLPPDRAQRLLDLQLEGIREAPLGVVVACDRRTPATGVLGRATFQDADMWSCACAIQNMWLTARALGLGMGWVTLFEPEELAELIGIPDGVETLGWLCLGWPDERPPAPGLERAGWAKRLPVDSVIMEDTWAENTAPPTNWKEIPDYYSAVGPEPEFVVAARDSSDRILAVPRALGVLDNAVDKLLSLGLKTRTSARLVLAAAEHPIAEKYRVTAFSKEVAQQVILAAKSGSAMGAVAAQSNNLDFELREVSVCEPGDLVTTDAMSIAETQRLIAEGEARGLELGKQQLVALGEIGMGNTTLAAALAAALLKLPAAAVVGLGAASDQELMENKVEVIEAALSRMAKQGLNLEDPIQVLASLGGPEFAYLTGICLGVAQAGGLVILDGLATSVAGLLAIRLRPAVQAHLLAGQQSRESAHPLVLAELGLEPLLSLRIRAGEGVGAVLATRLLLHGLEIRCHTAKTDA